jgi:hypothetical protein
VNDDREDSLLGERARGARDRGASRAPSRTPFDAAWQSPTGTGTRHVAGHPGRKRPPRLTGEQGRGGLLLVLRTTLLCLLVVRKGIAGAACLGRRRARNARCDGLRLRRTLYRPRGIRQREPLADALLDLQIRRLPGRYELRDRAVGSHKDALCLRPDSELLPCRYAPTVALLHGGWFVIDTVGRSIGVELGLASLEDRGVAASVLTSDKKKIPTSKGPGLNAATGRKRAARENPLRLVGSPEVSPSPLPPSGLLPVV